MMGFPAWAGRAPSVSGCAEGPCGGNHHRRRRGGGGQAHAYRQAVRQPTQAYTKDSPAGLVSGTLANTASPESSGAHGLAGAPPGILRSGSLGLPIRRGLVD